MSQNSSKKAIKFSWKKNILDKEIAMEELFIPYSYEVLSEIHPLRELFENGNISKVVNGIDQLELGKFEGEVGKDSDMYVSGGDDIDSLSLYDYLSDANAVIELYKFEGKAPEKLLKLSKNEWLSRELLFQAKVDLSMLINTEIGERQLKDLESFCGEKGISFPISLKGSSAVTSEKLKILSKYCREKISLYSYMSKVFQRNKSHYRSVDIINCILPLNHSPHKNINMQHLIDKIIKTQLLQCLTNDYEKLKKILGGSSDDRFKEEGCGCFAIMAEDTEDGVNRYFAISGIDIQTKEKENDNEVIAKNIFNVLAGVTDNAIDVSQMHNGWTWASLTGGTLSYLDMKNKWNQNNITYIDTPIEYTDYLKGDGKGNFSARYYSCCEKKIFARSKNETSKKTFYVRWEPCKACIPAFFRTKGEKVVHSFAKNHQSYKNNNYKEIISIQAFPSAK